MKNYRQNGDALDFVAPSGGVTSGVIVKIGGMLVVPVADADQGDLFAGQVVGVIKYAKVGTQAWNPGDTVFWDDTNKRFTKTSATGLFRAGVAANVVGAGAGETLGDVRLDGVSLVAVA